MGRSLMTLGSKFVYVFTATDLDQGVTYSVLGGPRSPVWAPNGCARGSRHVFDKRQKLLRQPERLPLPQ